MKQEFKNRDYFTLSVNELLKGSPYSDRIIDIVLSGLECDDIMHLDNLHYCFNVIVFNCAYLPSGRGCICIRVNSLSDCIDDVIVC